MKLLYFIIPGLVIVFSMWLALKMVKRGTSKKKAIISQICAVCLFMGISLFVCGSSAYASSTNSNQGTSNSSSQSESSKSSGMSAFGVGLIAAALAMGLSGIGGGIAVASAAPAAIAANAEDSTTFVKSLAFVALGEGIAIYGLVISIMMLSKIDQLIV